MLNQLVNHQNLKAYQKEQYWKIMMLTLTKKVVVVVTKNEQENVLAAANLEADHQRKLDDKTYC